MIRVMVREDHISNLGGIHAKASQSVVEELATREHAGINYHSTWVFPNQSDRRCNSRFRIPDVENIDRRGVPKISSFDFRRLRALHLPSQREAQ
jgi:hypothetical protein